MLSKSAIYSLVQFCVLLLSLSLQAQNRVIDSLQEVLQQSKDTEKGAIFNKLAKEYLAVSPEQSLHYAQKAFDEAKKNNNNTLQADALNEQGKAMFYLQQPSEAIQYFKQSLVVSNKASYYQGKIAALGNLGSVYNATRQSDSAIVFFEQSLTLAQQEKDNNEQARLHNEIGVIYYQKSLYQKAEEHYLQAVQLSLDAKNNEQTAFSYERLGGVYYAWSQYQNAIEHYEQALQIHRSTKNDQAIASAEINIGLAYQQLANYDTAIIFFQDAIELSRQINYSRGVAYATSHIARTYDIWGNYSRAVDFYNEALRMTEQNGDQQTYSWILANLANMYSKTGKLDQAIEKYTQALKIQQQIGDFTDRIATTLTGIVDTYTAQGNLIKAIEYAHEALQLQEQVGNNEGIAQANYRLARLYRIFGDYNAATEQYQQSLDIAQQIHANELSVNILRELSEMYEKNGNNTMAIRYIKEYQALKDSIFTADKHKQFADMQTRYETEKKQQENELLKVQVQNQRLLLYLFIFVIVLTAIFTVVVYNQYSQKKKANQLLSIQNAQITKQKQDITDSIMYASRIQTAIMPPQEIISQFLPRYFILNKPRNIVSGDFYWISKRDNNIVVTVADCTGHGVPGAFMSMLGVTFLNEIVNQQGIVQADQILNLLRDNIISSLHQTGRNDEAKDGMDIALCVINTEHQTLQFAGAYNPLILFRNGAIEEVKANRMPIGIHFKEKKPFSVYQTSVSHNDTLYLFSDGYIDQFGGEKGRKLMIDNFKNLLVSIQQLPVEEQKQQLDQHIEKWRGTYEQVDDIMVIGVQLSF